MEILTIRDAVANRIELHQGDMLSARISAINVTAVNISTTPLRYWAHSETKGVVFNHYFYTHDGNLIRYVTTYLAWRY